MKSKIRFIVLHLGYGGVQTATVNTANLLSKGYDVEIISIYQMTETLVHNLDDNVTVKYLLKEKPNREELKEAIRKFRIFSIIKEGLYATKVLYKKRSSTIKAIKSIEDGIVISTKSEMSAWLSKFSKSNVIKIAQEHHYHNNDKKYLKRLKNHYDNIDYLQLLTETSINEFKDILSHLKHLKYNLMPNTVVPTSNNKTTSRDNYLLAVGRFTKIKGFERLIDIFSEVSKNNSNWKLVIYGDGPLKKQLEDKIKNDGLTEKVLLPGFVSHQTIIEEMKKASIYCMTSYSECFPMVILEAMTQGLPTIAFDVKTGPRDIIQDNQTGFLIEDNAYDEYIKKLNQLIKNENIRNIFSNNCLEEVKKYYPDSMSIKWNIFLEKVIKDSGVKNYGK